MHWDSFEAFLSMGGRGAFVWGSYGVSFALIALELWLLAKRRKQALQRLARLQSLEEQTSDPTP